MGAQKYEKLKFVLDHVPPGYLIDTRTLPRHGITRGLARKYVLGGWLEPVVNGVYRRPDPVGERVGWRTVVLSVQRLMPYDSIVGARTALEVQGVGHYLSFGSRETVHLYGNAHPTWLRRLETETDYICHGTRLFDDGAPSDTDVSTVDGALRCSSLERAIFELLDELPGRESFHVVDTIFEGLGSLRPARLSDLLSRCRSVKVKRLFFVFADRHAHAWRKYLCASEISLGAGDRALVDGGRLHPRYRITIPAELMPEPTGEDKHA